MFRLLYPYGKRKVFNITYDDGILQDIRFVELLNKYVIKGTFNLNSKLMEEEFEWIHPCGMTIKRLSKDVAKELYRGHEIASHTLTHPDFTNLSEEQIMYELSEDKKKLEEWFGCEVVGFGVPFDYYDDVAAECVKRCGFKYARNSEESYSYNPWENFYHWRAGTYHVMPGFLPFVEGFFDTDEKLALCQIVGHSYDLDTENMWDVMENILKRVSEDEDIISMTHAEIVSYLQAMQIAELTEKGIENSSDKELWFEIDGEIICIKPGETFQWNKSGMCK